MVTRNDATLGIFNGDIGVVLRSPLGEGALRAYFVDGAQLRSVSVGRLADVETAFAMTVHKSQGSEFAHVVLVLPDDKNPVMTRELVYTGLTRAREAFTLVATTDQVLTHAMSSVVRRSSGLLQALHMA
jgi:exodeoxyribonuclease V alpha subunit